MTLPELADALDSRGVVLSLRLVVDAPAGMLTTEIKAALEAHKPGLVGRLAWVAPWDDPGPPAPPPASGPARWEDLARQRWGPAVGDPEPGIIIDRPDPARRRLALEALGDGPGDLIV